MNSTALHKHTLDALDYKADVARDAYDPTDPEMAEWLPTATQCDAARTVETLASSPLALRELEDYLGGDMPPGERRAIQSDLCRAGWYEKHNPDAVCSRRPRTLIVDGVRYVVA